MAAARGSSQMTVWILKCGETNLSPLRPLPLAGLIEVRGSGIHPIRHIPSARLHLAIELVEESQALRMLPEAPKLVAHGIALPCLVLPSGQTRACMRAILSHLGLFYPVLPLDKSD